jgi:hypothetical protein
VPVRRREGGRHRLSAGLSRKSARPAPTWKRISDVLAIGSAYDRRPQKLVFRCSPTTSPGNPRLPYIDDDVKAAAIG